MEIFPKNNSIQLNSSVLAVAFNWKARRSMKNPTDEQIRKRAYEIYLKHGQPGRDVQNWLQAERELKQVFDGEEPEVESERKSTRRDGTGKASEVEGWNQEFKKEF